jgi:hypothetical protein
VDCTAAGVLPIDCPFNYRDMPALEADLRWARRLGLKSKCAPLRVATDGLRPFAVQSLP